MRHNSARELEGQEKSKIPGASPMNLFPGFAVFNAALLERILKLRKNKLKKSCQGQISSQAYLSSVDIISIKYFVFSKKTSDNPPQKERPWVILWHAFSSVGFVFYRTDVVIPFSS